ncbi:hypothetical protein AWENTII_004860 [Aspergillus wentii]
MVDCAAVQKLRDEGKKKITFGEEKERQSETESGACASAPLGVQLVILAGSRLLSLIYFLLLYCLLFYSYNYIFLILLFLLPIEPFINAGHSLHDVRCLNSFTRRSRRIPASSLFPFTVLTS